MQTPCCFKTLLYLCTCCSLCVINPLYISPYGELVLPTFQTFQRPHHTPNTPSLNFGNIVHIPLIPIWYMLLSAYQSPHPQQLNSFFGDRDLFIFVTPGSDIIHGMERDNCKCLLNEWMGRSNNNNKTSEKFKKWTMKIWFKINCLNYPVVCILFNSIIRSFYYVIIEVKINRIIHAGIRERFMWLRLHLNVPRIANSHLKKKWQCLDLLRRWVGLEEVAEKNARRFSSKLQATCLLEVIWSTT